MHIPDCILRVYIYPHTHTHMSRPPMPPPGMPGFPNDPQKKSKYDQFGHAGMGGGGFHGGGMSMDDIFDHFGDIFGNLMPGGWQLAWQTKLGGLCHTRPSVTWPLR